MDFDRKRVSEAADRLLGVSGQRQVRRRVGEAKGGMVHPPQKPGKELSHEPDYSKLGSEKDTNQDASKVNKGKAKGGAVHDKVAPQFKESIHQHIKRVAAGRRRRVQ